MIIGDHRLQGSWRKNCKTPESAELNPGRRGRSYGLSNNYISNIENNHSIPSIDTLLKICEAIDTTPDYLLLGISSRSDAEEDLRNKINEKLKLCSQKKLKLIEHFVSWIIDEDI